MQEVESQGNGSYHRGSCDSKEAQAGAGHVQILDLGAGYTDVLSSWKFIELSSYDMFVSLHGIFKIDNHIPINK